GVPLVHRLDFTRLADQALLVGVLHPDHVPVAVQPVRRQPSLLRAEHAAVITRPIPEVGLQPPRHRIRGAARPDPPHDLVKHCFVWLGHVLTVPLAGRLAGQRPRAVSRPSARERVMSGGPSWLRTVRPRYSARTACTSPAMRSSWPMATRGSPRPGR